MTTTGPEWNRIDAELDAALDCDPAERGDFLARLTLRDPILGQAVGRMLKAMDSGANLLDRALPEVAPDFVAECLDREPDGELPAERIGPYRLLSEIGRGGMGAVYLAARSDGQYQQQVAIKLVRPGPDLSGLARRFRVERQILASLQHPNIAKLLDGGVTGRGAPYLVMEYVDGLPIDRHCEQARLAVDARLALFDLVAGAVEFAHQRLVVHRDLKPANILVSASGEVKLLDFGIAKLLVDDPGEEPVTRTGTTLATPEYASPEQIRGEPVSTASDVYALGVVLYELLSGRRPYRATSATPHELAVAICDEIPARPGLGADLDAILLRALAKEPAHRYGSVQLLRDDLRRYRDGFPVLARPATRRYLARRFLTRNRGKLIAAGLLAVAVVTGLVATTWQARAASRQARRAERVVELLSSIFAVSDPDRTGGSEVTARQLLDRGAQQLESELGAEPALKAEMLRTVGTLYQRLGVYDEARPLLERAGAVLDSIGAPPLDRAAQAAALASLLHEQGEDEAAESLARTALALRRSTLSGSDPLVTSAISNLAVLVSARGRYAEADSLYREALTIERRRGDDAAMASTLNERALLLSAQGRPAEARALLEEAVASDRRAFGDEHTAVATALVSLASVLSELAEYDSAQAILREAIAIRERLLSPDHPHLAAAIAELASTYQKQGGLDSAASIDGRVLALRIRTLGERHPRVAETYNNLAVTAYYQARFAEAADLIERALAIWRPTLGDTHPTVLTGLNNLGAIKRAGGDLAGAEPVLREVLLLRTRAFGLLHPDVAQSYNNLALLLGAQGKHGEADADFREAERIWRATLGERHVTVAEALIERGKSECVRGRAREAEPVLREGLELREAALDSTSAAVAIARRELAICLTRLGRLDEAELLLLAAIPRMEAQWGPDDAGTRRARAALDDLRARRD